MPYLPFIPPPTFFFPSFFSQSKKSHHLLGYREEKQWYLSSVLFSSVIWVLGVVSRSGRTEVALSAQNRKISAKLAWKVFGFHAEVIGRHNSSSPLCLRAMLEVLFLPENHFRWGHGDGSKGPEIGISLIWSFTLDFCIVWIWHTFYFMMWLVMDHDAHLLVCSDLWTEELAEK